MSTASGLILDRGYRQPVPAPRAVEERSFPIWTVVLLALAVLAAFAPSLAVTLVADLREPAPAACDGADGAVGGVMASAVARRATTEAVVAGHAPDEGRC